MVVHIPELLLTGHVPAKVHPPLGSVVLGTLAGEGNGARSSANLASSEKVKRSAITGSEAKIPSLGCCRNKSCRSLKAAFFALQFPGGGETDEIEALLEVGLVCLKADHSMRRQHDGILPWRRQSMMFMNPPLHSFNSFEVGIFQLGGACPPDATRLLTAEHISNVAGVLSCELDSTYILTNISAGVHCKSESVLLRGQPHERNAISQH